MRTRIIAGMVVPALLLVGVADAARHSATLAHREHSRDRPGLSGPMLQAPSVAGFFLVHYTTVGVDATTGTYAAAIAAWADASRQVFTGLDWLPPPPDGTAGGDSRYDLYLMGLGQSLTGYTQLEGLLPGGYPDDATSYAVLATGMTDAEASAGVAHHVHQACQYAYSANELGAWMEQSAGWIEELVFPAANQWVLRTGSYLGNARKYLFVSDGWTEQGALLWPKYLAESAGDADLIRRIWLRCADVPNNNTVSATQQELAFSGLASLQEEFQTFTAWNYLSGVHDDGMHYDEGDQITGSVPLLASHASYPAEGQTSVLTAPYGLGASYAEFLYTAGSEIRISLDGSDTYGPWGAGVIAISGSGQATYGAFAVDAVTGMGDTTIAGWSTLQRVVLVVQNLRLAAGAPGPFCYTADVAGSSPPSTPTGLVSAVSGDWIRLTWSPSTDPDGDLEGYHVYRSTRTFLPLPAMTRIASAVTDEDPGMPGVQWTDQNTLGADVVGDEGANYFWVLTAVDAAANESPPTGAVGEFDFLVHYP